MTLLGMSFEGASKADLETTRFLFSALAPFVLLVLLSFPTPAVRREVLDRFFAKMHTKTRPDPEEDRAALEAAYGDPESVRAKKLLGPDSAWEFGRPSWFDAAGFFGSWGVVGLIIWMLWLVTRLGAPGFDTTLGLLGIGALLAVIFGILIVVTSLGRKGKGTGRDAS